MVGAAVVLVSWPGMQVLKQNRPPVRLSSIPRLPSTQPLAASPTTATHGSSTVSARVCPNLACRSPAPQLHAFALPGCPNWVAFVPLQTLHVCCEEDYELKLDHLGGLGKLEQVTLTGLIPLPTAAAAQSTSQLLRRLAAVSVSARFAWPAPAPSAASAGLA